MLRLTVYSPSGTTDAVVGILEDSTAVSALAVVRGAALRPAGDLVTADVAREGANDVIDALRETGVHRDGTVHVEPVSTWLSAAALEAEDETPGSGADAVVWSDVVQRAYTESELNWTYMTFMVLATFIAAVAVVLDSVILVIGAMVLGPEFVPIAAVGVALVRRRAMLLRRAVSTLLVGFLGAIAVTVAAVLLLRALGWVTVEDVTGDRPGTSFVYRPDRWSFVVAAVAAAAGVLSLTSARLGGLSGVFISVTTVPAAGNIALGLAFGVRDEVIGSAAQLALNLSGMALAGWATLAFQQAVWSRVKLQTLRERIRSRRAPDGRAPPGDEG